MKEFTVCDKCKNCIKSWSDGGDYSTAGWNRGCMKHEKPKYRSPESGEMIYVDSSYKDPLSYMVFKIYDSPLTVCQKIFGMFNYDMKNFAWCDEINKDGNCEEFELGEGVVC